MNCKIKKKRLEKVHISSLRKVLVTLARKEIDYNALF